MYLKKVLSGLSEGDIEHRTAEAHRAIFGQHLQ
jgi:hypothetical protein